MDVWPKQSGDEPKQVGLLPAKKGQTQGDRWRLNQHWGFFGMDVWPKNMVRPWRFLLQTTCSTWLLVGAEKLPAEQYEPLKSLRVTYVSFAGLNILKHVWNQPAFCVGYIRLYIYIMISHGYIWLYTHDIVRLPWWSRHSRNTQWPILDRGGSAPPIP